MARFIIKDGKKESLLSYSLLFFGLKEFYFAGVTHKCWS
jgi:hypothetical protein